MISFSEDATHSRGRGQRVLFTASARPAQVFPAASLGSAFQAAGHDVLVASEPSLVPVVAGTGLATTAIGLDRQAHGHVDDRQLRQAESMVDDLVQLARRWRPDMIVHDAASFAGAVAGAVTGVPTVSHLGASPAVLRTEPPDSSPLWSRYARLFARFGVEPRLEPTAWVDPCPPSMALPAEVMRLPVRFVPSHGPRVVPAWLLDPPTRARVCVPWWISLVATADDNDRDTLRQVMAGLITLDAEIVLIVDTADRALCMLRPCLDPLLDASLATVRVVDSIALPTLLRTCDAVVHQGWAGTTLMAAACGTRQLVVGREPEQILNGDRLFAVGAGRRLLAGELPLGEVGADIIGTETAKLLDRPAYSAAAQWLRAEIEQQPTPAELVCTLARLTTDLRKLSQDRAPV